MQLIARPRRLGKTMEAIRIAAETGAYLIVATMDEAKRVADVARSMNMDIRYPITFDEFQRTRMAGSHVRNVVIDNADEFLARIFSGLTIEAATWTTVDDDWIEWAGGPCPVQDFILVDVKLRAGHTDTAHQAGFWSAIGATHDHWQHEGSGRDIVAYRKTKL